MKPFKIIALLFSAFIMASSSFAQDKKDKIGTVDMQKLLGGYTKSQAVLETFKGSKKKLLIIKNGDHSLSGHKYLKRIIKELDKIVLNVI